MKMKKIVSVTAALAITMSAFAGLTITASADETLPLNFDFTQKSLTALTQGNKTVFEAVKASEAGTTAMTDELNDKVLRLGSSGSGTGQYLGYKSDMGLVEEGAITLSYDVEPMQVSTSGSSTITVQFADSNLVPLFGITAGTRSNATLSVDNGTSGTSEFKKYYKVSADINFYNQTVNATIKSSDNVSTISTLTNGKIAAENLQYLYFADADWRYGYVAIDNLSVVKQSNLYETTFRVSDNSGAPIADANIKLGAKTLTTDSDGTVKVSLPNGDYSYEVSKAGTAPGENATGSFNVSDASPSQIEAKLDTQADVATVTVNYYVTGSKEVVPVPETAPKQLADKVVGSEISISDIYTDTFKSDDSQYKYVFNAGETTDITVDVPYKVKSNSDGNTINVYFDKNTKLGNITVEYKSGEDVVATVSAPLSNNLNINEVYYENDPYTYYSPNYVKGTDDVYYAVDGITSSKADGNGHWGGSPNANDNSGVKKEISSLTSDTKISYTVTPDADVVYFADESGLSLGSAVYAEFHSDRYIASGGAVAYGNTSNEGAGIELYRTKTAGNYQVVLVAQKQGSGTNARGTAIFASVEDAKAATSADDTKKIVGNVGANNNTAYAYYDIKTTNLAADTPIILKGFGNSDNSQYTTDNIDYILIRDVTPEVEFKEQAEFRKDSDTEASMRFLASPTYEEGTVSKYGFWFVNTDNMEATDKEAEGSEALSSGDTFHYTFDKNINIAGASGSDTVGFYAIPWVVIDGTTVSGKAFTYGGTVGDTLDTVTENTKTYSAE